MIMIFPRQRAGKSVVRRHTAWHVPVHRGPLYELSGGNRHQDDPPRKMTGKGLPSSGACWQDATQAPAHRSYPEQGRKWASASQAARVWTHQNGPYRERRDGATTGTSRANHTLGSSFGERLSTHSGRSVSWITMPAHAPHRSGVIPRIHGLEIRMMELLGFAQS